MKKLDSQVIDHDLNSHLFLLNLLQNCITGLLQIQCIRHIANSSSRDYVNCSANVSLCIPARKVIATRKNVKLWRRRVATFGPLLANYFIIKFDEDNSWSLQILRMDESHLSLTENVNSKSCVHLVD